MGEGPKGDYKDFLEVRMDRPLIGFLIALVLAFLLYLWMHYKIG